ncbi:DUF4214 domain-containing protein [Acidithiobacillus ferrooxidans]|nr:DUF4214 domain-containing protein [Acidithiobacillus ferrooxidans]
MKAQSITKRGRAEINLHQILALPHEEFLPQVFYMLIGRDPDPVGLLHYASRLQKKISRTQVVVEIRNSAEGKEQSSVAPCRKLDILTRRYLFLKRLPLGNLRWRFLPRLEPSYMKDDVFPWIEWASNYIRPTPAQAPVSDELDRQVKELQAAVEHLRTDLARGVAAGSLEHTEQHDLRPCNMPPLVLEQLPYGARSIYLQILRRVAADA